MSFLGQAQHSLTLVFDVRSLRLYADDMARAKRMIERRDKARADAAGRDRVVATNRRARHDFEILETIECGVTLTGSEVKSLREGKAQIADGYA